MRDFIINIKTSIGDEPIHIVRSGQGVRRFIVWHGFNSVNRLYPWAYLENLGELIRVGLPGHGPVPLQSWTCYKRWTPEHFVEIALGVHQYFCDGRPLVVVGHSVGAYMALSAAIRASEEMSHRLILMSPMLWSTYGRLTKYLAKTALWPVLCSAALGPRLRRMQQSSENFLKELGPILGDPESFYGNKRTRFYVASGHEDYRSMHLLGIVAAARVITSLDIRSAVASSDCNIPTLVVHGEADPVSPLAQSEWLSKNMSSTTLVRLRGAGHISYGEREQEFETLVPKWLEASSI